MKLNLLILFSLLSVSVFAQHRTCGKDAKMQQIMSDPIARQQYLERQSKFEIEYQKLLNQQATTERSPQATITIPVAVHFPSVSNASSVTIKDCFRALAQTQIDVINADYNASNTDISNWPAASAFYPGVNTGNLNVQFVIATQNHPAGTGLVNGDKAVTFGTDFLGGADSDATWAGYMNFVVRDEGASILGYSPLAGSPAAGQTVVMNTFCFGTGSGCTGYQPQAPFNLGRTVTHELGHFFNLDHTFGGSCSPAGTSCTTQGDKICDTPRVTNESYGCPAAGSVNACASLKSLTMNYMDYVDDPCMYMFTQGQATRALAYINSIIAEFKPNTLLSTNTASLSKFAIYPNPNKGSFTIQFADLVSNYSVKVCDQTGRIVFENEFTNNSNLSEKFNLNETAAGIYFVTVKADNTVTTKKIIIE
ncbi:zinc-dependent metalloprotease [Flavobacterium sp. GT3R68]|uniref:zinc-dependent metalloprotease n=1 Tax=Flavobacterium sp. GT3R68 TaxID=2594437 RepID=UPI00131564B7|nr:zinc-dependent metalloprotease [Flavobacterium sp. GT3R68]